MSPRNICLWKWSLVSMCSSLRARLNALRRFFHTRLVEEISAKYCWKSGIALKPYVYHKLGINWYTIIYNRIGILGKRTSMPKVYQWASKFIIGLKTSPPLKPLIFPRLYVSCFEIVTLPSIYCSLYIAHYLCWETILPPPPKGGSPL